MKMIGTPPSPSSHSPASFSLPSESPFEVNPTMKVIILHSLAPPSDPGVVSGETESQ